MTEALGQSIFKDDGTVDRSRTTPKLVRVCIEEHLSVPQIRWVIGQRGDLAGRLGERNDDDLTRCILIAYDSYVAERFPPPLCKAEADGRQSNNLGDKSTRSASAPAGPKRWSANSLKTMSQPKFLASNRIPFGAVTILCGDEGIGKSLFWVWIVAAVTTGKPLPEFGIPERDPANVVLVLTEDDWRSCVLPRLTVAGADLDRVEVICTDEDGSGAPVFPDDMAQITDVEPVPALVVVDAWLDTVPAKLQVRDAQQSRLALHPWKDAAVKTGAAVLLLTHTNRLATANMRDKYGATISLRQKTRMTLYALGDPKDGTLIVGPDKANSAPGRTKASRFRIVADVYFNPTEDHDGTVPSVTYAGSTGKTIRQHLAEITDAEQRKNRRRTSAEEWLIEFLADGPRKSTDVYTEGAKAEGEFTRDQLKGGKDKVGRAYRDGDCWWWELLPEHMPSANTEDGENG